MFDNKYMFDYSRILMKNKINRTETVSFTFETLKVQILLKGKFCCFRTNLAQENSKFVSYF